MIYFLVILINYGPFEEEIGFLSHLANRDEELLMLLAFIDCSWLEIDMPGPGLNKIIHHLNKWKSAPFPNKKVSHEIADQIEKSTRVLNFQLQYLPRGGYWVINGLVILDNWAIYWQKLNKFPATVSTPGSLKIDNISNKIFRFVIKLFAQDNIFSRNKTKRNWNKHFIILVEQAANWKCGKCFLFRSFPMKLFISGSLPGQSSQYTSQAMQKNRSIFI